MKIEQLPLGSRFQLKGRTYTKVGPMTASDESGGVAFIPKHASLRPVPGETPPAVPPDTAGGSLDAVKVRAAFETYHQTALSLADEAERELLEAAGKRFLSEIR